jgi:hypothetical protein
MRFRLKTLPAQRVVADAIILAASLTVEIVDREGKPVCPEAEASASWKVDRDKEAPNGIRVDGPANHLRDLGVDM